MGNPRVEIIGPGIFFVHFYYIMEEKEKIVMKTWKIRLAWAMFFIGLLLNYAYADDTEPVEMDTVVVTGTRTEQQIKRVPANVTVISPEDIQTSNANNVVDLLRTEQGIVVRDWMGNGKTAGVDLRGFGETASSNSLVLIDGRRVNSIDLSGIDWTQIPLEQIDRVEIVRGTGTVLYGDNAVGGVINIITKTPSEKMTFNAEAISGSYSRNKEQISLGGRNGDIGASLFASYDSSDGYRENSELRAKNIGGKIVFDPTAFLGLRLSSSYHSDIYGMPGSLSAVDVAADRRSSNNPLDGAKTRDGYLNLGVDLDLEENGSIVTDFSYRDRTSDSRWGSFLSGNQTETWGFTPRYTLDKEIFDHGNMLIVGTDLYWSEQDTAAFFFGPSSRSDIERDSLGFYANDEFSLLENLILSVGARRERVQYDLKQLDMTGFLAPLDDTVTERENGFSAGLTFLYSGNSSLFVRANRSFRFPLTDEFILYDYLNGLQFVNADLKPQRGRHYEMGIRHYFAKNIQGNVTLFRAEIKDEIFFNPDTFENTNHPKTLHQGIEIGSKADFWGKLTVFGNYTYEKTRFEKDPYKSNDVPAVPRHKANFGFRVYDFIPRLIFSADYNYVGASYVISDQANSLKKLDDYSTIDLKLSYAVKNVEAFFGLNNLINEEYSEYGVAGGGGTTRNFYPAPERNWLLGVKIDI